MEKSYVYIISSTNGRIKIGFSKNPQKRLRSLQTGNDCKLTLEYTQEVSANKVRLIEQKVHDSVRYLRKSGEWFAMDVEAAKAEIIIATMHYDDE